ncbi:unnamed protein product [Schistosoma turkestanicum]|nr:unnamed protein product [Schistosoma turkestanicum]
MQLLSVERLIISPTSYVHLSANCLTGIILRNSFKLKDCYRKQLLTYEKGLTLLRNTVNEKYYKIFIYNDALFKSLIQSKKRIRNDLAQRKKQILNISEIILKQKDQLVKLSDLMKSLDTHTKINVRSGYSSLALESCINRKISISASSKANTMEETCHKNFPYTETDIKSLDNAITMLHVKIKEFNFALYTQRIQLNILAEIESELYGLSISK